MTSPRRWFLAASVAAAVTLTGGLGLVVDAVDPTEDRAEPTLMAAPDAPTAAVAPAPEVASAPAAAPACPRKHGSFVPHLDPRHRPTCHEDDVAVALVAAQELPGPPGLE